MECTDWQSDNVILSFHIIWHCQSADSLLSHWIWETVCLSVWVWDNQQTQSLSVNLTGPVNRTSRLIFLNRIFRPNLQRCITKRVLIRFKWYLEILKALGTSENGAVVQEILGIEWQKVKNGYIIVQNQIKFRQCENIELEPEFFYLASSCFYLYRWYVLVESSIIIAREIPILLFWVEKLKKKKKIERPISFRWGALI